MTQTDLQAVRYARLQIISLEERIIRLRSALESCTAKPLTLMPGGRPSSRDKLGDDVARLLELEERQRKQIIELEEMVEKIEMHINGLHPLQAAVIRLYYIDGKSWRQISRALNYNADYCRQVRDSALKHLRFSTV